MGQLTTTSSGLNGRGGNVGGGEGGGREKTTGVEEVEVNFFQ